MNRDIKVGDVVIHKTQPDITFVVVDRFIVKKRKYGLFGPVVGSEVELRVKHIGRNALNNGDWREIETVYDTFSPCEVLLKKELGD